MKKSLKKKIRAIIFFSYAFKCIIKLRTNKRVNILKNYRFYFY